ncbi:phage minor capsid protein [Paenibacillus sp. Marseille-P2973]|uniref:phage minor capsid protein n=1 Tax=Paenibacillus sp. Marseille-P2973 TaxID=1871032 RepID=UPI001FFD6358|nr:phage minor capsid protein [Paenibacillus sp. Marseille-P2973]
MADAEKLIALYTRAGERLLELIRSLEEGNYSRRRKESLLMEVDEILAGLTDGAAQSMAELLAEAYKEGVDEAADSIRAQSVPEEQINTVLEPLIHQQAVQAIMDDSFLQILEATDNMSQDAKRRVEETVRTATERMLTEGVGRRQATKEAVARLAQQEITGIVARNGARIPADKYMAGVVQYNLRKAHVTGAEKTIVQNGLDLVYVNYVGITCEYCAKYQGRVYSISGTHPRFPKLEVRPPYHSHCVHSLSAWIEDYQAADEVERMVAASNRPFTDNRTEANIRRYNEIQRDKVRKNETRKQWIRYKAVLPNDTPDLRRFASLKARGGQAYKDLQELYRKANVVNREQILPKNVAVIKSYGQNVIMVREQLIVNGPEWKSIQLAEAHLAKRKKRGHIPADWTMENYDNKIRQIVENHESQVYQYRHPGFDQDYYVFGDGTRWIAIIGQDGKLETAFPFDNERKYRNYLNVDEGYTYIGTTKEVYHELRNGD